MALVTGDKLGTEICQILGIDATKASRIVLTCTPNDAAQMEITIYVDGNLGEGLISQLKKYKLEEVEQWQE